MEKLAEDIRKFRKSLPIIIHALSELNRSDQQRMIAVLRTLYEGSVEYEAVKVQTRNQFPF